MVNNVNTVIFLAHENTETTQQQQNYTPLLPLFQGVGGYPLNLITSQLLKFSAYALPNENSRRMRAVSF